MNTTTNDEYDPLDAGEFSDADLRERVRAAEEALVRAVGPSPGKDYYGGPDSLHIDLPDDSSHCWALAFRKLNGEWRIVVLEENSRFPSEDRVTVGRIVPLAEAGLAPLLHFLPNLDALAAQVLREVVDERDGAESGVSTKDWERQ